ncbi:TLR adapter interacting with SLC15A4 on the lysosome-like [Pleurodeles waltl]|uniref:TLR adapter interacting with SLC15A4 on the lysosome-like n=1 Tax=Pleurodeles waltl TaxID=8319 RepID=UPI00370938A1
MLAEGLFPGFLYENGNRAKYQSHKCPKKRESKKQPEAWKVQLEAPSAADDFETDNPNGPERKGSFVLPKKEKPLPKLKEQLTTTQYIHAPPKALVSAARHIPKYRNTDTQMDLNRSWTCSSICTNYPDLHIGGDHIGRAKDSGCILDLECEITDGPMSLSVDIPPGNSPNNRPPQQPPALNMFMSDESRDKGSINPAQPLSNSPLNICMERKLEELYNQLLADNVTLFGSPTKLLSSSFFLNSVNQVSSQLSQEQNIEASKAREVLLHCLRSAVSCSSSEISTPILQISKLDGRKNLDILTKTRPC